MEFTNKNQMPNPGSAKETPPQYAVHHVLAHSYSLYFFLLLLGVFLDIFYPIKVFKSAYMIPAGVLLLVLSSLLILWAQKTSRNLQVENLSKDTFCKGPYCYTRSPTHWGLFLLMLGFGIIANAVYIIIFTIISFIISKLVFLKKEESILANKYGAPYLEYKKTVKL